MFLSLPLYSIATMIFSFDAHLTQLSIHRVGNKSLDTYFSLSDRSVDLSEDLNKVLLQYFLAPFDKVHEISRFFHPNNDLSLNVAYRFISEIFDSLANLHANSEQLARHLFEVSDHPKIKAGELYVAYFNNVQIEGEVVDAIGIFKSENRDTYLKVAPENGTFEVRIELDAINIKSLDKGCLIFKTEKAEGYKVAVVDQTNRSNEAVYWKDDFLQLKVRNDSYNQTNNTLGVYKRFVTEKLDEDYDISKTEKIDMLNRSLQYFKEKETFDLEEFGKEVIGNEQGFAAFKNYKETFEEEHEAQIDNGFDISNAAVKKQARVFKSVLKLDKNFHIYIHGNKELIKKGYDDDKNMSFYKVYFKEEV